MYIPIIRTGEAEIRAISKLTQSMLKDIRPIIELTRGRQKTTTVGGKKTITYPFENRLTKIKQYLNGLTIFMDLTTDENLLSSEVYHLYKYENGYENWCNFITENIGDAGFGKIIPSILFNWDDEDFKNNFRMQIETLCERCGEMMYRSSIQTKDCYDELPLILDYFPNNCDLWIILDCGYIQDTSVELAHNLCKKRINNINKILNGRNAHFVITATSYPERVHDYSEGNPIIIKNSEVKLHESLHTDFPYLYYGDYAGTNPIRKDMVVMARGWIPKIDIPLTDRTKVYWKRRPNKTTEYKSTYIMLAEDVINDYEFPIRLRSEWGIDEIFKCSNGDVTSSVPNFWISVRIYNHMNQQLMRLKNLKQ